MALPGDLNGASPAAGASADLGPALARLLDEIGAEARWEATDLQLRWGKEAASGLLRGRSAELSFSPLARDQLLAVALDQTAGCPADRAGQGLLAFHIPREIDAAERLAVLACAQDTAAAVPARAEALVDGWVRRFDEMRDLKGGARRAAQRLFEDAALNRRYWNDERIPADRTSRALMLTSADLLAARAADLRREDGWLRRLWRRARGAEVRLAGRP